MKVGKSFWWYCRFCYFLYFPRKLSEGQEIDHMIKSAKNRNLEILKRKIFVFSLWILLIELRILLLFPFFVFESHDLKIEKINFDIRENENESTKNREAMANKTTKSTQKKKRGANFRKKSIGTILKTALWLVNH